MSVPFSCIQHNGIAEPSSLNPLPARPKFFSPMADGTHHAPLEEHFSGFDEAFLVLPPPGMNSE
jgi:hypothetical protein